jgi:hypothetical protein
MYYYFYEKPILAYKTYNVAGSRRRHSRVGRICINILLRARRLHTHKINSCGCNERTLHANSRLKI